MTTILDEKKELRENLRKRLISLTAEKRKISSLIACDVLIEELKKNSFKVLSFASKPFEINLWPLNQFLAREKRLLLPKVNKDDLEIYQVDDVKNLRLSSWNIQEPCPSLCPLSKDLDLILVPGLGFDTAYRIGYGKGHYDRLLASFPHTLKWGIGFEEQKCIKIPVENHDLPLDRVFFF